MGTWDKGLELEGILDLLRERIKSAEGAEYSYLAVLLTQASNGCRVGEAIEALKQFEATGNREARVTVEKRRDKAERLIVIPQQIDRALIVKEDLVKSRVKMYAKRKLGINTHSLRYAWITAQVKNNVNPGMIAAITGHKNLNMLMHYIQKKQGEEYLRQSLTL